VAHLNRSERGISFVIFALAIVVLLGMVAVGIDGGRLYDERRQAQNAADHAALAAAFAACTSTSTDPAVLLATAVAAGLASADENGYDDNGTTNDVTITSAPGSTATVPRYQARVDTTIGTTFARVIGFSEVDTNALATAEGAGCDETGGGTAAIHAGGTSCPGGSLKTVEFNGNNNDVTGKTYAYGGFRIGGGDRNDFLNTGGPAVEYAGTWEVSGNDNTFVEAQEGPVTVPAETFPDGWAPSDLTPALWAAYATAVLTDTITNNNDITTDKFEVFVDGIYYTDRPGGVVVEIKNSTVDSITIVNKSGPITIGDPFNPTFGARTFTAYPAPPGGRPDALLISGSTSEGKPCEVDAIRRSGEGATWDGIWWAPNGLINISGNFNHFDGGLIAHAVHFRGGNDNTVRGGSGVPAAVPSVTLTN
jgi:Flp pilus assembly protein TadG